MLSMSANRHWARSKLWSSEDRSRRELGSISILFGPLKKLTFACRFASEDANCETVSMNVTALSFGYRLGVPREADYVFDCRLLSNPYFVPELRRLSGQDTAVKDFLAARPEWTGFVSRLADLIRFALPLHEAEGKPLLTLAFGCTGGRHRSVAVAEAVAELLRQEEHAVRVVHRDIGPKES